MYDAYAYIIEGKKKLISQSDMTFSHQYTHKDKYHIEDNENETCPVCGKKSKHIVVWGIQY